MQNDPVQEGSSRAAVAEAPVSADGVAGEPRPADLHDATAPTSPPPPRWRLGNRPPLTGIRAPLMAFVLVFHSNYRTLPGSWISLGLFFVLSGFLITAMLAGEHQRTGGVSLRNFYSRRAVRLLPPLFITVALLAVYASVHRVFSAANDLWTDVAAAVFYFADYRSALGHEPAIAYLSQCWSLAVEEQFYLLWAILLFVALRYASRRAAYLIAAVGVLAAVGDRLYVVLSAPRWDALVAARAYYAFDTRADALFLGCLLGLLATGGHLDGWGPLARRALSVAALASTVVLVWILLHVGLGDRGLPLWWVPVSEVAAVVLITFLLVHPMSWTARLLGLPVLVLLGNTTYAVYLFHWPVYVALSQFTVSWPFWELETVRVVIILSLALASWFLVEKPLMAWRRRRFAGGGPEAVPERVAPALAPP
ncbi:MAG TPA: acyltransferase [Acidimicrobiales bacterium]|nr:acyltransferase [Acidimicrobiales bacterium]